MLEGHFDWILNGAASFAQPNDASRKLVMESKSVSLKGKKFAIEPLLRPATLKLSLLLDLDELQTHILLKRWIKDTEQDGLLTAAAPNAQISFELDAMMQVLAYYHEERLMLLKCMQFILLQGIHDPYFASLAERLYKGGAEDKVFTALRGNLDAGGPRQGSSAGVVVLARSSGTMAGRMAGVMKEFSATAGNMGWLSSVHRAMREQMQRERCELLSTLLLAYDLPAPSGLQCSSHRCLELVRMLGGAVFEPAGDGGGDGGGGAGGGSGASSVPRRTIDPSAAMSEQLACLLLLATLDLGAYVRLMSGPPPGHAAPVSLDDLVPLGGKVRDVHNELRGWAGTDTNALLLLTWSAIIKLLEPYVDFGEASVGELQARAFGAGGFGAMADCLQAQAALMSSAFGPTHRGVLLKALCLMSTAFELGPSSISAPVFGQLLRLLKAVVGGDAGACAMVWDDSLDLTQPVRAMLRDAVSLFPADLGLTVQLLGIVSCGPAAASAAYAFLQTAPRLAVLTDADDPNVLPGQSGGDSVTLGASVLWDRAPSVATMVLPAGIDGRRVSPTPACLAQHEAASGKRLVVWDVGGSNSRSFGQLLILGRCAHCVASIETALRTRADVQEDTLSDLHRSLELLASLCANEPGLVPDLMSLTVDLAGSGAKVTWLDVAVSAASALAQLAAAGLPAAHAFAAALQLLRQLSHRHPFRVLAALPRIPALCPSSDPPSGMACEAGCLPRGCAPLVTLPRLPADAGAEVYCGLVPGFRAYEQEVEAREGCYPGLMAFLELVADLLEAGHVSGPLPTYALHVLHELLPNHHQLPFKEGPAARWALTSACLRVLRASIEAGAHVAPTPADPSQATPADVEGDQASQPTQALHVTPLSAHVLSQLLLHGPGLLAPCVPPTAAELDGLRCADLMSPELASTEAAAAQLLALVPTLIAASKAFAHELPIEEFLFYGSTPSGQPPAALLAGYVCYAQPEGLESPEGTLSYLALKALQAMQVCVSRPVGRPLMAGLSMSLVLPRGGPALAATAAMFDPHSARQLPRHLLLAVEILEGAAADSEELLDALLFPTGLEPEEEEEADKKPAVDQAAPAAATAAGALVVPAPAAKVVPKPARPRAGPRPVSALDGLAALLGHADELLAECPEVLCHALRGVCALWQQQGVAYRPVQLLRAQHQLWDALEAAVTCAPPPPPAGDGGGSTVADDEVAEPEVLAVRSGGHADAWLQLAEAYAWQVLMLEAYAVPRPAAGAAASDPAAGGGGVTAAVAAWALLDRVVEGGVLTVALKRGAASPLRLGHVLRLQLTLQAAVLELGACCLGGALGEGSTGEDCVPASGALRRELAAVRGGLPDEFTPPGSVDVGEVHAALLAGAAAGASPGALPLSAGAQAALSALGRAPLGRCLLGAAAPPAALTMEAVTYGPGYLFSEARLAATLGPAGAQIASTDALRASIASLGRGVSVASARLSALQAAAGLAAVLPKDPRCSAALQPGGCVAHAGGVLEVAMGAVLAGVAQLLDWAGGDETGLSAPGGPLFPLQQYVSEAALTSTKLLLHALASMRGSSSSGPPRGGRTGLLGDGGPAGGAAATQPYGAPRQAPVPEARTLFPATPASKGSRGGSSSGGASGGSGALSTSSSPVVAACLPLVALLARWLRAASSGNLGRLQAGVVAAVTDALAGAALLTLQQARSSLLGGPGSEPSPDLRGVQSALLDALPHLCRLCGRGAVCVPVGMQLVSEAVARLLPPADWLPVLHTQLDLTALIVQAASRVHPAGGSPDGGSARHSALAAAHPTLLAQTQQAGDLGLLQLALLVAQRPEGARLLHEQAALERLSGLARHLLSPRGGNLAPFNSLEIPGASASAGAGWETAAMSTRPFLGEPLGPGQGDSVDVAFAYARGSGAWSPAHQQWCVLLSFSSVFIRTLSQHVDVETQATDLLVAAEPRLLLACVPPAGTPSQPLTLASLFELERVLFLLTHMTHFSGAWHMLLPGSLARFRTAVSSFIAFAAGPSTTKGFGVACPPHSAPERAMAAAPAGLPRTEGWFRACTVGATAPSHGGPGARARAGATAATEPGGPASALMAGHCSEYSGRLAELMYGCTHHALAFLLASSPQLSEGEAAVLGPQWPRARDLSALQDQCMGVLYSMADTPRAGGGVEAGGRRKQICQSVLKVLQLLADLLDAVGYPPARRDAERSMREQLAAIEAALSAGDVLPQPLSPGGAGGGGGGPGGSLNLSPGASLSSPLGVQ
ncbi:hypothetical protein FOA52_011111 [Chlamydomonas sp. UWO 241]|nr:hypothetical protein FOA52_011111 [Chlamydomonas sp. UWO 241]